MKLHARYLETRPIVAQIEMAIIERDETYEGIASAMLRQLKRLMGRNVREEDDLDALFDQLTPGERLQAIGNVLSSNAKWWIRSERHPEDPNHPGDAE